MPWSVTASPIGDLAVAADDGGVYAVRFSPSGVPVGSGGRPRPDGPPSGPGLSDGSPSGPGLPDGLRSDPGLPDGPRSDLRVSRAPGLPSDFRLPDGEQRSAGPGLPADSRLAAVVVQLRRYFAGELMVFDLPLSVRGGSDFERAVWAELARIPYGETRTYGEIATATGDPGAARAVGVACNRNPLPLVVPCHRVVGAGGKLVGFGGGLHRKRFLLELESRVTMESAWR